MPRAVVLHEADNVATLMHDAGPGEVAELSGRRIGEVRIEADIPFGHKVALAPIERGGSVIKYGQVIGKASDAIAVGMHVHVHNLESVRGRGDLVGRA